MVLSFQADVCPMPISVSPTHADFLPVDIACPMSPETFSSFVVCQAVLVYQNGSLDYFHADLNIESGVESHRQVALIIFIEHTKETLLEDGRRERV
jgi:hypothetical protein